MVFTFYTTYNNYHFRHSTLFYHSNFLPPHSSASLSGVIFANDNRVQSGWEGKSGERSR